MSKIAYHRAFTHPLPEKHKFPMKKYVLLAEQLVESGIFEDKDFFEPELCSESHILAVHKESYWQRLSRLQLEEKEIRKTGFPMTDSLIERERLIMEGSRKAAENACKNKSVTFNIAGGTHHSFSDKGEGFCLLNDIAISLKDIIHSGFVKRALSLDLDVHQGNGTAEIFNADDSVFTFSMHAKNNYPVKKEKSDLDIELHDGIDDDAYFMLLENNLKRVLDDFQPEFIFYQSGVDVLKTDKFGRLGLTIEGCKRRDELVFSEAKKAGIGVVCAMGGGYSPEVQTIVDAHLETFKIARAIYG